MVAMGNQLLCQRERQWSFSGSAYADVTDDNDRYRQRKGSQHAGSIQLAA
jgi:hypothetical protein